MLSPSCQTSSHLRNLSLATLGRVAFDLFDEVNIPDFFHLMLARDAAHGAELLLKARIAEEHPFLIFSRVDHLTMISLAEAKEQLDFDALPERLHQCTGIQMTNAEEYRQFGVFARSLLFAPKPESDIVEQALKFLFHTLEPLVVDFWGDSILNHLKSWDPSLLRDGHFQKRIQKFNITLPNFTTSIAAALSQS